MKNKLERFTLVHVHSHPSLIFVIKGAAYFSGSLPIVGFFLCSQILVYSEHFCLETNTLAYFAVNENNK
jgi:hypothetical protein